MNELILIADDEQDIRELLRYYLEKEKFRVILAQNGEEAIRFMRLYAPDLAILDIMMPELSGWEVCSILRKTTSKREIPIIMLTAITDEESRIKGFSFGADDYVSKPFSVKELLLIVRQHLDRYRAMQLLQIKEKEHETSLRYLVHELRNSLTVIEGYSTLALEKGMSHHYLKTINSAALQANSLLQDASLLNRLEKNGGSLPLENIDIAAMMAEVVDIFIDRTKKTRIKIHVMESSPLPAMVNKFAIRQVLVNLISNAIKYNRPDGNIWISYQKAGDLIEVTIQDEGCGIRQDEIEKIFNKFYRAGGSEHISGIGLGLYIVKLLTESMDGKIFVTSEPGAGSAFTVSFRTAEMVRSPVSSAARDCCEGTTILDRRDAEGQAVSCTDNTNS